MSVATFLRSVYLSHLSSPASDRTIYRGIRRQKVRSILELGIGTGHRAVGMIEMAQLASPGEEIRYAGTDLFEGRTSADGPGVTLRMAHRLLTATGAKVRLSPGDPLSALARLANSLTGTDLVVISARQDLRSLEKAWFYLPRILHAGSQVFIEEIRPGGGLALRRIELSEIDNLATAATTRRAA